MIPYELALQMKEAGYSNFEGEFVEGNGWKIQPTLEEVLEACGEKFGNLGKYKWPSGNGSRDWLATQQLGLPMEKRVNGEGSNPLEAVCRLWLALRKK